ncbi:MAG TPA: glycosyltransferase family 4 protein, partial [Euzebya sp.]|nr:glycosyltransferase family 4 protein [Euzebya sp.]
EVLPAVRVQHDKGASATPALGDRRLALVQRSWLHFHAVHGGWPRLLAAAVLLSVGDLLRLAVRTAAGVARGQGWGGGRRFRHAVAVTASPPVWWRVRRAARRRQGRVLFTDHAGGIGGGQRSLLHLLRRLPAHGVQPVLAAPPGPLATEAAGLPSVIHVVWALPRLRGPGGPVRWLVAVCRTWRLVRRSGAAVVHANTVRAALVAVPAARLAGRAAVWQCRDFWLSESEPRWPLPHRVVQAGLQSLATCTVAVSDAVATQLPRPAAVIRNGIDLAATGTAAERHGAVRTALGLPGDARILLHAGRLRPWKGADVAVRAVGPLLRADPRLLLVLAGGTPLGEGDGHPARLAVLAAPHDDQVRLVGHVDDLPGLAAGAELLLATGEPEPFGLVVAEALAVGLPVLGFAHGALPELLGINDPAPPAGVVVEPGTTPDDLTPVVAALLADPGRRAVLGAAGRRRARALFDADRTAAELAALLHDQAGPRRTVP